MKHMVGYRERMGYGKSIQGGAGFLLLVAVKCGFYFVWNLTVLLVPENSLIRYSSFMRKSKTYFDFKGVDNVTITVRYEVVSDFLILLGDIQEL